MNIVIKLPNKLDERVLSFPFLHTLHHYCSQKLGEDEVLNFHLLSSKEDIDALYLLPFDAFYHEIDPEDLKSIFTIHRGVVELKIDNPEIFISATESFVDASIGKNLNIPRRAGFALGKNKIFLTNKIEKNHEVHFSDRLFPLIKVVEPYPKALQNSYSRALKPPYADWQENPYVLIDISAPKDKLLELWREVFDLCANKNFILMSSDLNEIEQEDQIKEFIKTLPTKNTYKLYTYLSNIELARVAAHSRLFVSAKRGLSLMASYAGASCLLVTSKDEQEQYGPKYFRGETEVVIVTKDTADQYSKVFDYTLRALD